MLKITALATAITLLLFSTAGWPITVRDQTLRYAVTYVGHKAGELEISIRNHGNDVVVSSTSHLSKLARLFLKAHTSETRFVRRDGMLSLDRGAERLLGEENDLRSYQFNWDKGQIQYHNGENVPFHPDDQFEAVTFPLLLIQRPVENVEGVRVREVSSKRVRDYTYEKPARESVKVPAGGFTGWRITRRRADRPATTVTVWLSQGGNPIPVKIETINKGRTTILQLLEEPLIHSEPKDQ